MKQIRILEYFILLSCISCKFLPCQADDDIHIAILREIHTELIQRGGFEIRQVNSSGLKSVGPMPNIFKSTFVSEMQIIGHVPDTIVVSTSENNPIPAYSSADDILLFVHRDSITGSYSMLDYHWYKALRSSDNRWFLTEVCVHNDDMVFYENHKEKFALDGNQDNAIWGLDAIIFSNFIIDKYYNENVNRILLEDPSSTCSVPHDMVDLGLSVMWSAVNLGATEPYERGSYVAWGETSEKSNFSENNYCWYGSSRYDLTKYNSDAHYGSVDKKSNLDISDDIVSKIWGGGWRLPTWNEWQELIENCLCIWTTRDDRNGILLTSKINGNCIFLPAGGMWDGNGRRNQASDRGCHYWSSDAYNLNMALSLICLKSNKPSWAGVPRHYGLSVRPVWDPANDF